MNRIAFGWSFSCFEHALQALLEVAAVLGAREQRAHVERVDDCASARTSGTSLCVMRQARPFGDRGLAHAGLADEQRIVLAPAAQDLDHALDFVLAADQRIDLAVARELVQVLRELVERRSLAVAASSFSALGARAAALARLRGSRRFVFVMPWEMKLTTSSRVTPCWCR